MKKKLESELISIAHRILKLKGKEDVMKMYNEVTVLQEKLAVLKFAHENFEDDIPTIGSNSSFFGMLDTAFNNKVSDNIEVEDRIYVNLDEKEGEEITQPLMEKIKDMVAQMPQEAAQVEALFEQPATTNGVDKNDFEDITADFAEIPEFEPIEEAQEREARKKTLNDKLKGGALQIGLNDKIAFIKHLFDGKNEDYDRVISQLNTTATLEDAKLLIQNIVKPDYNNWEGKEEYEERLLEIVEGKFN